MSEATTLPTEPQPLPKRVVRQCCEKESVKGARPERSIGRMSAGERFFYLKTK